MIARRRDNGHSAPASARIELRPEHVRAIIAHGRSAVAAALAEYQRLRLAFPHITDDVIEQMKGQLERGEKIGQNGRIDLAVAGFAHFAIVAQMASRQYMQMQQGEADGQTVQLAFVCAAELFRQLGGLLVLLHGGPLRASFSDDYEKLLAPYRKASATGQKNIATANEQRQVAADEQALKAVQAWRDDPVRRAKLSGISLTDVARRYLRLARPPRRQASRLQAMLRANRIK